MKIKTNKAFKDILAETKEYVLSDEVDTMNTFIMVMIEKGFDVNPNDSYILSKRGWLQRVRLNRCGQHKKFYITPVIDELNDIYKHVKANQ